MFKGLLRAFFVSYAVLFPKALGEDKISTELAFGKAKEQQLNEACACFAC